MTSQGINTTDLMARMDDLIIKTILSAESVINQGIDMFLPKKHAHQNCFELLGFDILIDEDLKPWLLEVNLTPSLVPDSEMDFNVKANLLSDLFSLAGIQNSNYVN